MRQPVYTMFISNNRASFHWWWKENLVKHQRASKYYENDCRITSKNRPSLLDNIFINTHDKEVYSGNIIDEVSDDMSGYSSPKLRPDSGRCPRWFIFLNSFSRRQYKYAMDTGGVHGRGALILSKSALCLRKSPFLE